MLHRSFALAGRAPIWHRDGSDLEMLDLGAGVVLWFTLLRTLGIALLVCGALAARLASLEVRLLAANVAGGVSDKCALLYDMARGGDTAAAWHGKVDGVPRTVTIMRASTGEHWFGVYTARGWGGADRTWLEDAHALLFTLSNPWGIPPTAFKPTLAAGGGAAGALLQASGCGPTCGGKGVGWFDLGIYSPFRTNTGGFFGFPSTFADTSGAGKGAETFTGKSNGWTVAAMITCAL